jgi:heme-degrading monooxygenase HmoA
MARNPASSMAMDDDRIGWTAVIFAAQRTGADEPGYGAASQAMCALAARQPGYRGIESARGTDGFGITVSYWADDGAAKAWRDHPQHAAIRDAGRGAWYESYRVTVARVERGYSWCAA